MSPNSAMLMAMAAEIAVRLHPNSCFERHHQHTWRGADTARDDEHEEGDRGDDPGVVEAAGDRG
jgi:hypothetical protein